MLNKLLTVFRIPELRRKILLTLILLAVYRMGFSIPLPFIDQDQLAALQAKSSGDSTDPTGKVLQVVSLFSASSLSNATIFGLGIMPYISASIIFQLLGSVYPPLEKLQKEGESGRRKITEWTRYATVLICIGQSYFWIKQLSSGALTGQKLIMTEYDWWLFYILGTVVMTAGTIFLMWIGEQDRRLRHRQRHQPADHGRHPGPDARRRLRPAAAGAEGRRGPRQRHGHRHAPAAHPAVRGGRGPDRVHHAGAAPHPDPEPEARPRPPQRRRSAAEPAPAGQPGRRDADHLRQQPADVPVLHFPLPRAGVPERRNPQRTRSGVRRAGVHLQPAVRRADLLLLLLLDGNHLQPEGHGGEPQGLRLLHPPATGPAPARRTTWRR